MPYIKDRKPFYGSITKILDLAPKEGYEEIGKFLAVFIGKLLNRRFAVLLSPYGIDDGKYFYRSKELVDQMSVIHYSVFDDMLFSLNTFKSAGELNYVLSTVILGAFGSDKRFLKANYGLRAYVHGTLSRAQRWYENHERFEIAGALGDVILEVYRRDTSFYEDGKILENGDLFPLKGQPDE